MCAWRLSSLLERGRSHSLMLTLLLSVCALHAQQDAAFEKSSLGWRTALHFDPGAEAPLRSLVGQHQAAGRVAELVGLYTEHLAQFPDDEGAKVVLARLYLETRDTRAESFITQAVAAHPQSALLARTRARWLESKFDPRALEALDAAIALETVASRRALWLGELLTAVATAQREDIVLARLGALVKEGALSPAQRLQWARRALELGLSRSAGVVMVGGDFSSLQGDEGVEARFIQARVALANGQRAEAALIAKGLLDILAADHWRRREALLLRWQTAVDAAERERLLAETQQAWQVAPQSEAAALAHGDLLVTAGRKDEALKVWRAALQQIPSSRLLEERVLDLLEQTHQDDAVLAFLAQRIEQQPEREDLALRRARGLLLLGRLEAGMTALDALLAKADARQRAGTLIQTARWLRTRNLFGEGARVLEALVAREPGRWDARKELAELYALLRRREDMERLFEKEMPEDVAPEVRLEVAQFLISQRLWAQARRSLEAWVVARPAEFDARLLLAKICALSGDDTAAARLLDECRAVCDTEARYAAWLAAAWERADAAETTADLIRVERARLWPQTAGGWDAARLSRLSLLAQQTLAASEQADAEKLLRAALAAVDLPVDQRRALRLQLIAVLEGQQDREKDLEAEIKAALDDPGVVLGDLQLRLALMYAAARRGDLARSTLDQADPAQCQDSVLVLRAAALARQMQLPERAAALYGRLVRLQPDERAHWTAWTGLLMEKGDEEMLRAALREMRALAGKWHLSGDSLELLRRHLAASCWRSVGRLLADEVDASLVLRVVEEVERLELDPQRRLWAAWVRGAVALRAGDEVALAEARQTLAGKEEWVEFPDGLALSLPEARRLLEAAPAQTAPPEMATTTPQPPLSLAWAFEPGAGVDLQRWELTPDGARVIVLDARKCLYCLDRRTGKLLWQRRIPKVAGAAIALPTASWNGRGEEQINQPAEWAVSDRFLSIQDAGGLACLGLEDGAVLWQTAVGFDEQGPLTQHAGRVLWWRPHQGRLDAFDAASGRLVWTRRIPPLSETPPLNPANPQWLASGIHADAGRVLVWGNGGAVLGVEDGRIQWQASAARSPIAFPLELRAEDEPPSTLAQTPPLILSGGMSSAMRSYRGASGVQRTVYASALAVPSYGYPGMYGAPQTSPWITWGAEGTRLLRGGGVWMVSQNNGTARWSVLGLPVTGAPTTSGYSTTGIPVGFAGKLLLLAGDTGVVKVQPGGQVTPLWYIARQDNRPARHPLPAVALAGRTVCIATQELLRLQDAITGTLLWEGPWPEEAQKYAARARASLDIWQNLRWSTRGLYLYDGKGRTLALDWRALAAGGDWILPAGTRALVCLRGPPRS